MAILGADGKPATPPPQESATVRRYRANIEEAYRRSNQHFLDLMLRGWQEDQIRRLRQSCGQKVSDPFHYVTKDEEE